VTDTGTPTAEVPAPTIDATQAMEILLHENLVLQAELSEANAVISAAIRANLAATSVLEAANGMVAALKESPLEQPLADAFMATTSLSDWVLVGAKA
jgi:hypothetical protein